VASSTARLFAARERVLLDAWQRRGLIGRPVLPCASIGRRTDLYQQWAWVALRHGHLRTARKYAIKSLIGEPASLSTWRLAFCAARGH
jgi:hypothetical protein